METQRSEGSTKIALVGYGKMGREIERLAPDRHVDIVARYDSGHPLGVTPELEFDAAIEFTRPDTVLDNVRRLLEWNRPIVVGTTGWHARLDEVEALVTESGGRLVYASNFSIGVNAFLKIVREAAILMDPLEMYDLAVHETHHVRKADAPSGTALSIAGVLLERIARKSHVLSETSHTPIATDALHVTSQRLGATVGMHTVIFDSEADTIELTHRAKNRAGFALGAILAAEWIIHQKPGLYRFEDVF